MKPKNCLIFGASGQIGRHLIRKLTKNNYKVTAVTRNLHQKGYVLKTQANAGYIDIVELNIFNENKLKDLISSKLSVVPDRYKDIDLQIEVSDVSDEKLK